MRLIVQKYRTTYHILGSSRAGIKVRPPSHSPAARSPCRETDEKGHSTVKSHRCRGRGLSGLRSQKKNWSVLGIRVKNTILKEGIKAKS